MPHSVSARKRVRQNARQRRRNRAIKSRIRTVRRAFDEAFAAGNVDETRAAFRRVQELMHRAAANGPLHRNTAGRLIGRMQKKLDALAAAAAAPATDV